MPIHICPVCGTRHPINAVEHPFAYGRQLTCGPHCKHRLRQRGWRPAETGENECSTNSNRKKPPT